MTDHRSQLEAFKAAASVGHTDCSSLNSTHFARVRYLTYLKLQENQSQLLKAPTREEALNLAISAAENLVKALNLCTTSEEKKELRSQCSAVMDAAERIKSTEQWLPQSRSLAESAQPKTKHEEIGMWAASVAQAASHATALVESSSDTLNNSVSESSVPLLDLSSSSAPSLAIAGAAPTIPGNFYTSTPPDIAESKDAHGLSTLKPTQKSGAVGSLIDLQQRPSCERQVGNAQPQPVAHTHSSSQTVGTIAQGITRITADSVVAAASATGPRTQVRRLVEPTSTRELPTKERILLFKASVVNGFKFPPWEKNPSSSEFALEVGADLFLDSPELDLSAYQHQFFDGWVRAKQALPPPSMLPNDRGGLGPVMGNSRSIDLVQDAATDCSVVASLCAGIARSERGHEKILSNMIWPYDKNLGRPVISSNGKYIVRLNFNGCWRKVIIDDRLPTSKTHRLLHVVDRHNPALLWPALLEKAYLKVRGGYDFPGSNSCSDLWTLTGWVPEQIYLQENDTVPDQLWTRIYNAFLYGDVLVTVGTGKMSNRQEKELGLEGQHSYVVLDMKEIDHERLLLVKNPWVEGKGWRGARTSTAPVMHTTSSSGYPKTRTDAFNGDSTPLKHSPTLTTFWIALANVIRHFESLYLNWNPGLFRYRQDIHFEWAIEGKQNVGGCVVTHPQFSFTSKEGGPVWFLLCRHFRDTPGENHEGSDAFNDGTIRSETQLYSAGDPPKGYMSIVVCNGKGHRIYVKDTCLESGPYVNTPQSLLKWESEPNSTYTIVVDQADLPDSKYTFSLSAFSNSTISLEEAGEKYPYQKRVSDVWSRETAGGNTSSPRYFENPQHTLEVRERSSLALVISGVNHQYPLHVKLAHGYGKRMYRLHSRDILVDSGEHRSGCAFAEIKDLQPGTYTIICSLFDAGKTGLYDLRVDSTSIVILKQIPRDGAGLVSMKLAHACFGPQIHKIAAPIQPHRLAKYIIIARFVRATSPRSMDLGMLARSPLRLSVELGRGPERKFMMTSEQGEYSDSATVRSDSFDLEPTIENKLRGDMWLVLDRLSGPGAPVEEWYEVEIFTDVPQPCTVGVWRDWDD
ncbi:calpain-like protease palB/rim-13, partial [Zopfia rhizophila CBS 207.26]